MDTLLVCRICGETGEGKMRDMMRNGWVFHCGEAMHIEKTDADAVNKAVLEQRMRYNETTKRWEHTLTNGRIK